MCTSGSHSQWGAKDLCNKYRPISLISLIHKIFEKLLCSRRYFYIEQHKMFSNTHMVLEVDCQHLWLYMTYMKTFCKAQRKDLLLVLHSVICLRSLIPLIMRYFYGSWNIFVGLEVYHTNFLRVICKTDSCILLLGSIGQLLGGNSRDTPGFIIRTTTICLICEWPPTSIKLNSTLFSDDTLLTISCANSANLQNWVNSEQQKLMNGWDIISCLQITQKPHIRLLITT